MSSQPSPNGSLLPLFSPNAFMYPGFHECTQSVTSSIVFISFTFTAFLLIIPLSVTVVYVGIQRWRKQRHISNTDFLTYNIIAFEPIGLLGCLLYCVGIYMEQEMMEMGIYTLFLVYTGRLLFHCLTCVEQYLAVIHPLTYLHLKTERGLRVRNASVISIWVLCLVMFVMLISIRPLLPSVAFFVFYAAGLLVIFYCSLSVLCALIRPGPGEMGADRKKVHDSKKRAFYNIATVTGVMVLKYFGLLVCITLHASTLLSYNVGCVLLMSSLWFCLPSSLSVPLLFLYRAQKLPCFSLKGEAE